MATSTVFPHGPAKDGLAAFLICHGAQFRVGTPIRLAYGLIVVGKELPGTDGQREKWTMRVVRPRTLADPMTGSWLEVVGPDGTALTYRGMNVMPSRTVPSDVNTIVLEYGDLFGRTSPEVSVQELTRMFDLTKIGKYTLRWIYNPGDGVSGKVVADVKVWGGEINSNEVTIDIVN